MTVVPSVLLIEDEPVFAATVARYLENEGFDVKVRGTGDAGLVEASENHVDMVLLDLQLPDMQGFEVLRRIRLTADTPVIILSALSDEADKVKGLELGADDYAVKTTSPRELLARMRAVTRRSGTTSDKRPILYACGYKIDRNSHIVSDPNEDPVELTHLEFDLLVLFASNPGVALERELIFNKVWNQQGLGTSRTIDTHVVTLRTKMPDLVVSTIRGVGYRLEPNED